MRVEHQTWRFHCLSRHSLLMHLQLIYLCCWRLLKFLEFFILAKNFKCLLAKGSKNLIFYLDENDHLAFSFALIIACLVIAETLISLMTRAMIFVHVTFAFNLFFNRTCRCFCLNLFDTCKVKSV